MPCRRIYARLYTRPFSAEIGHFLSTLRSSRLSKLTLAFRFRILIQVTTYRRLLIGRDGHLDQSEAYEALSFLLVILAQCWAGVVARNCLLECNFSSDSWNVDLRLGHCLRSWSNIITSSVWMSSVCWCMFTEAPVIRLSIKCIHITVYSQTTLQVIITCMPNCGARPCGLHRTGLANSFRRFQMQLARSVMSVNHANDCF